MRILFAKRERAHAGIAGELQRRRYNVVETASLSNLSALLAKPTHGLVLDAALAGDRLVPILELLRTSHAELPVAVLMPPGFESYIPQVLFAPLALVQLPASDGLVGEQIDRLLASCEPPAVIDEPVVYERPHVRLDALPSAQRNPAMKRAVALLSNVADSDVTVLISGESGVGKELFARTLHARSQRRNAPFIDINCAALPSTLLEAELFGAERGAYTGALQRRIGKFEQAQRGTMFLDEVSEMDISLQAKLLRVIQEKELYRVGGDRKIPLDVRLVATTNRDLREWVTRGHFRQDLYYRLNVIGLYVPPLRERKEDIPVLVSHTLERFNRENRKDVLLTPGAMEQLCRHQWPGNIRELENALFLSAFLTPGRKLEKIHFDDAMPAGAMSLSFGMGGATNVAAPAMRGTIEEMERVMIRQALAQHSGNRTHAANSLGISVRTLRNKLRLYPDLDPVALA